MTAIFGFQPALMTEKLSSFLPPIRLSFTRKQSDPTLLFEAGVHYLQNQKFAETKERFHQCLSEFQYWKEGVQFTKEQLDKFIIPSLCHLATCHLELREFTKTTECCDEVLKRRPNHRRALYLQGVANVERGAFHAAMKYYKRK